MFEHKNTKQREQNPLSLGRKSREVREAALSLFQKPFAPSHDAASASAYFCYVLSGELPWISCNHVTRSNNWQKYGIAAREISTLWLKTSDLHAFVLGAAKAAFALRMNMLLPLSAPTKWV
jgi:hypothetical protein